MSLYQILKLTSFALLSATAPEAFASNNTELMKKGMWQDPATGLIWDRCSLGRSWNGSTCVGDTKSYSWYEANNLARNHNLGGYNDWQLPTQLQLATLIKCTKGFQSNIKTKVPAQPFSEPDLKDIMHYCRKGSKSPQIDENIFPWFPSDKVHIYWSSTPSGNDAYKTVEIGKNGTKHYGFLKNGFLGVVRLNGRLVRTKESLGFDAYKKILTTDREAITNKILKAEEQVQLEEAKKKEEELRIYKEKLRLKNIASEKAYNKKVANFRKNIKVGDDTSKGMVIEVKGDLIKIQTNEEQCSQRNHKGKCINWINTSAEKWFKLNKVYP